MASRTEAWEVAMASCPPDELTYYTLEIWHSSFDVPARVVTGVGDDMQFGIEASAARNAGEMVTFIACPVKAEWPEQREGFPPQSKVSIDNVNRELRPKIKAAMMIREYIKVIYREYLDSDLTEPSYGPVEFTLKDVTMTGATLTGTATVANLLNKRFPRRDKNYSAVQFPSLLP
jgi:hypothetical protein